MRQTRSTVRCVLALVAVQILLRFVDVSAQSFAYSYDSLNRLTRVAGSDGVTVEYTYDAAGNRLTSVVRGTSLAPQITSRARAWRPSQTTLAVVGALGTLPLSYQWYEGSSVGVGTPIADATSGVFAPPARSITASYWVRVSNAFGSIESGVVTVGPPFSDDVLVADSTPVRAVHVSELRQRIDAVRVRFGLSPFAWAQPPPTPQVTLVQAGHITEMRTALAEAYVAAGATHAGYTDPVVTPALAVKMAHIAELRSGIVELE